MKGNRVGRGGRGRPAGRESQQGEIPLPMIGSPFGPLGPMQPLTPGMSLGSGPLVSQGSGRGVSSSLAESRFNNSRPVGWGAQPDKKLNGFVGADWAGDVNDKRSTRGFVVKNKAPLLCQVVKQNVAATMATQECL
ncbi:N6-adenosine-methyltransferase non-catalytic subunit MTB, partial [Cucurbita argyrosperma subsp. sororia]